MACLGSVAHAQTTPPPITQGANDLKRAILQRFDVPASNYETVIGKHTHFGFDRGALQSGDLMLNAVGRSERILKPGDSWQIPPNTVHWGKAGPNGAKYVNSYVVEKKKPLATPVP
jgi:quercetin dioxygenase-like cupin family protein